MDLIYQTWPWFISGPLIGLFTAVFLSAAKQSLSVSTSLQRICELCIDKRREKWQLAFALGIILSSFVYSLLFSQFESHVTPELLQTFSATRHDLIPFFFKWAYLSQNPSVIVLIALGGFLIGFGSRYADGCTAGHAILGTATLQKASLVAMLAFFLGGFLAVHFIFPLWGIL